MASDPIFQTAAGWASIIALAFVLFASGRKAWAKYARARDEAEAELERLTSELRKASGTIGARTDIGFLVMLRLGSMRDDVAALRHYEIVLIVFTAIFLMFAIAMPSSSTGSWDRWVVLAMIPATLIGALIAQVISTRWQRYSAEYATRVTDIWETPVTNRSFKESIPPDGED